MVLFFSWHLPLSGPAQYKRVEAAVINIALLLNTNLVYLNQKYEPATPGVPNRSPMQVLTGPNRAWLRWSDENRYFHGGMVAADITF